MNLGVDANGLLPQCHAALDFRAERRIKTSIMPHGVSIPVLTDAEAKRFDSMEFSLDLVTVTRHDTFHGSGHWRVGLTGLER